MTSSSSRFFSNPEGKSEYTPRYKGIFELAVESLLQHTAKSDIREVEIMVKKNRALILSKGTFTEEWCGQRNWTKLISPLQRAAWAGDTEIVDMFLLHIPDDWKQEALEQLKEIRDLGTEHGKHLSPVRELIYEYRVYHDKYCDNWRWKQQNDHWPRIGLKQLHSVVNLLHWFCSDIPFDPKLNIAQVCLARSLLLPDGSLLNLAASSSLGVTHSLYKGTNQRACLKEAPFTSGWGFGAQGAVNAASQAIDDFEFVNNFFNTRSQDLNIQISKLEADLQKLLSPANQESNLKSYCVVM